jgi:CRP/FNR family cyclic AMP-dependent transcriptional regulator
VHRHKQVQHPTRTKNQLQATALSCGIQKKRSLWTKAGREKLENLPLLPYAATFQPHLVALTFAAQGEIIICISPVPLATLFFSRPSCALIFTGYFGAFEALGRAHIMKPVASKKKLSKFDPQAFLATFNGGRKIADFPKKQTIFVQGDPSDAVFYIQKGKVKLTVVSQTGKEATIAILGEGEFLGEGCLTGQPLRLSSATAMTECSVMRIEKKAMMEVLHREHAFSDMFVAYLLTRNIRYEEDLVDQLFNSSEKRLARVLLLLAHFGKEGKPEVAIPKITQETLAEMVGTTRSRVSFFMNRFRKLGFIDYQAGDELQVHSSLLNIVLHD